MRAALGAGTGALRRTLLAESLVLCGAGAVLGVLLARPLVALVAPLCRALLGPRARRHRRHQRAVGRRRPGDGRGGAARLRPAPAVGPCAGRPRPGERRRPHHAGHQPPAAGVRDDADCVLVRAARRRRHAARHAGRAADARTPATTCGRCWRSTSRRRRPASAAPTTLDFYQEATRRIARCPASRRSPSAASCRGAMPAASASHASSPSRATRPRTARRIRARGSASSAPGFFAVLGVPLIAGRDFTDDDRRGSEPVVDRQPERRAAAVPERRRGQPAPVRGPIRYFGKPVPRRIVGVVADVDDENVRAGPAMTIYQPVPADRRRRPAVRARRRRSVRAGAGGDARHSRDLGATSRSSAPRRSRTCARRCCRRSG